MYGFEAVSSSEDGGVKGDIEQGTLYPGLGYGENQLRWGFIRKVYGILTAQILLTTVVSAITVLYAPVNELLRSNSGLLIFLIFLPFIRRIVLEALILTSAVVSALTGYTFWAAKKGKDFSFMGPILFTGLFVLILTGFIQAFFPLGSTSSAIYSAMGAIIFCGYIVYDTDNLIKRFTYDQYIWASVTLYLDVLNLFLTILRMLRQGNN
nr:BI1-like protein [Ipomoea batatas]